MNSKELKNKFAGTIVGFAVGDALGMPAQFLTREQIRRYYGKPNARFIKAHEGHASDFLPPGSYTDDTQMMMATAESLIEHKKMDPARQAEALLSWYTNTNPHRTPARANLRACKHLLAGRPWTKSGVFSSGCHAAGRMPPIGLLYHASPDALVRAALEACTITHTEPRARAGAAAVAYLTARLVLMTGKCSPGDQVLETADRIAAVDSDMAGMLRWVTQIVHLSSEEALFEIGTSSDAIEAIPAAVYCYLKFPRQFTNAITTAVNAGDASDSIAAYTGSFVGSTIGLEEIPKHWQQDIENFDLLVDVAESLFKLVSAAE
jgi:ADP-ribosylglycohydrolase